nr:MAG TPA: hypothetical protein [Bacteriophage sp.]
MGFRISSYFSIYLSSNFLFILVKILLISVILRFCNKYEIITFNSIPS